MVEGNQVPGGDEIGTRRDVVAENNETDARLQEDYRRTVGFQPQDVSDQRTMAQGYDRNLGYDRIAVGNTALGQRIDNITNLLAMGERSSGNLQDVNRYYGRAQKEADDLFTVAAQNVMKGRDDYRAILNAKSPQEVFQGVNASIQKQAQALQLQLQQEQDPARQRRLTQLLAMEQERMQTLDRMSKTQNPQELNRLLMYDAFSAQRIDLSQKMLNERDPNQVRLMAEAEQNLHTVQRAPGFTRANYGMLLMRLGQYDPNRPDNAALRALQDAASVDPEMVPNPNSPDPARRMGDPNFMRVASDITRMRPDDPRFQQAMAPIFNRDINRSPAPLMASGDQNVNPNARYSQVQDQPFNPATDGSGQRDRTQVNDRQGVTPLVNGKTPFQRVQELAPIAQQQGLTPDVRSAYQSCVQDSDKGTSPRVAELQAQLAQLEQKQQAIAQQVEQIQKSPEIQKLVTTGMEKLKALKPEDQQQLKSLTEALQKTQDKQEREKLLGQIGQICPEFVQVTRLLEEKLKPFTDQINEIQKQGAALSGELIGEMNQSSATRMEYAEKLMASGKPEDKQLAKQLLIESVAKAQPDQREAFAQAAMKLGLTQQELQQGLAQLPRDRANVNTGDQQTGNQTGNQTQTGDRTPAGKEIDDNKKAFDAATDKKAKYAEMQPAFKKAIEDADKELATYVQLNDAHTKAVNEMPAEDKAKFQKMLDAGTSAQEKDALQKEMMSKYANIVQLEQQMGALTPGKDGSPLDLPMTSFEARFEYARAANLAGDDATSKAMMEEGLKKLTQDVGADLTKKVLEDPGVAELVQKNKIDVNALMQAAATEAQSNQPAGDGTVAGGDLQGTLRVANARMQKGDIAGAKQAYEQAIKMVDATFNPEENNRKIKEAQDALESGNLTIEQRLQKHQEIATYFNQAYQAFDIRSGYARVLSHPTYNQNAAAEQAFKDAIAAADRVPVQAMKRQLGILANDAGTFQTAFEQATGPKKQQIEQAQAFLTEFTNTLNGQTTGGGPAADKAWMNTQINARKDLASFYVRLVTDVNEKGEPILKPDGTPRYVADPSKVFKPEEGMKAIDEAKAKYKELYGTDLDKDPAKDPTLAILSKGIYDNSPAELQKKYQNVTRFWDQAAASVPTLIAGTATAILMAKYRPLRGLIGESALATWGSSLLVGSSVAGVTQHGMMTGVLGRKDQTFGRSMIEGTALTLSGVALIEAPKLFSRNITNTRIAGAFENAGVGRLATKGEMGEILTSAGMTDSKIAGMLGTELKGGAALSEQTGFGLKHLQEIRTALGANKAAIGEEAFLAQDAKLAKLIEDSAMRTKIFNIGRNGKNVVADFDAAMASASPSEKQALLQQFLKNKETQRAAIDMVANTEKYAATFEANGLQIKNVDGLADKLTKAHVPFTESNGMLSIKMNTVGELKDVLPKLAEINPRLFGTGSATKAGKSVTELLGNYKMMNEATPLKEVWANAARGGAEEWKSLDVLKQLVPEAQTAARSRFANAVAAFREEKTLANMYGVTKEATISTGKTIASPVTSTYKTFGKIETLSSSQIGRQRALAGAFGGVTSAAAYNYPTEWYTMYGSGEVDPSTGKPYEFNLSNAFLKPAWKSSTDNIFIAPALFGGMMAKPGGMLLAQAPWANAKTWWKPFSMGGHLLTGSTWNYMGARAVGMPLVGEALPAITTNLALRQFDLVHNLSNYDAGRIYSDAIKKAGDPIVDEQYVPKAVPQEQAPAKKPANGDAGVTNQQPRKENTDLTGGAPQ